MSTAATLEPGKPDAPGKAYFCARRVTHANLVVSDPEATMNFYTGIAGIEEAYRTPKTGGSFVSNGNTHHDMGFLDIKGALGFRAVGGKPGLYHIGFELECESDLVEGFARAQQDNIALRPVDHDVAHSLYAVAPSGFTTEVYADVIEDFRAARSGTVTKDKPKWYPGMTPPSKESRYHANPQFRRVESAAFHPQRFSHVVLVVEDFEDNYDHYTGIGGMMPLAGSRSGAYVILGGTTGDRGLCLFRRRPGGFVGCHHIGFKVADVADLRASIDALPARGITPDLVVDHPARLAVYLRDPDGVPLQFYAERGPLALDAIGDDLALLLA